MLILAVSMRIMTDNQPDPELWRAVNDLYDLCRRRGIELVAAARFPGGKSAILSRVGGTAGVLDLLDMIRTSVLEEGEDHVRH